MCFLATQQGAHRDIVVISTCLSKPTHTHVWTKTHICFRSHMLDTLLLSSIYFESYFESNSSSFCERLYLTIADNMNQALKEEEWSCRFHHFYLPSVVLNTAPVDQWSQCHPCPSVRELSVLCQCVRVWHEPGYGETNGQSKYNPRPLQGVSCIMKSGMPKLGIWLTTNTSPYGTHYVSCNESVVSALFRSPNKKCKASFES